MVIWSPFFKILLHLWVMSHASYFRYFQIMTHIYDKYRRYAYKMNQNFMTVFMKEKIFKFAHANFLNSRYLKMRRRNWNFDKKSGLSKKFPVEWYMMIMGFVTCRKVSNVILFFTPTQLFIRLETFSQETKPIIIIYHSTGNFGLIQIFWLP